VPSSHRRRKMGSWGKGKMVREELFLCNCMSPEHQMIFSLYDWGAGVQERFLEDDPAENITCTLSIYLQDKSFWRRVWTAIRYVFGYRSKYGNWDCISIDYETAGRMIKGMEQYQELVRKYTKLYEAKKFDVEDY
jgi:hypothetical protein